MALFFCILHVQFNNIQNFQEISGIKAMQIHFISKNQGDRGLFLPSAALWICVSSIYNIDTAPSVSAGSECTPLSKRIFAALTHSLQEPAKML